jgi:ABC-2 type transport system permease protein
VDLLGDRPRRRLKTYVRFGVTCARTELMYRGNYLLSVVSLLVQIYLLKVIWTSVYRGEGDARGVDLATMIAYVTLSNVQIWFIISSSVSFIPRRVREGRIAVDMLRPIGLLQQNVAGQLGRVCVYTPIGLLVLPLTLVLGGMRAPASWVAGIGYLVSFALALLVAILMETALALMAFWVIEVRGIFFVYRQINQFFAGALVPLWLMPDWLRLIAEVLPFRAIASTPVMIYLGRSSGAAMFGDLALQLLWIGILFAVVRSGWRLVCRKVVIQGG